ncbi:MAG: Crp/Fnr family transcriptional regulator [Bradyrhizobium sp.]|nr:Crp/Fnr family transcriptional regulator [Bradyrhizobium sp.]
MDSISLCVTCPNRLTGFCGALLGPDEQRDGEPSGWQRFFAVEAGAQIATRRQQSADVLVLCAGWAFRYFQLADGRRQILQFLLPGDVVSPATIFEGNYLFSAKALTEVVVSGFVRSEVRGRCATRQGVQAVLATCSIAETRDAAELATVLGRCSAEERIAYLLLRLIKRIAAGNVIRDESYPVPLRQQHIADAVGLTTVHVSRVFGLFRKRGILTMSDGILRVTDRRRLEQLGSLR